MENITRESFQTQRTRLHNIERKKPGLDISPLNSQMKKKRAPKVYPT